MKVYELIDYLKLCAEDAEIQVFYTIDNPLSEPNEIKGIMQFNNICTNESNVIIQIE